MVSLLLQEKIDYLHSQVERLLHVGDKDGYKCADDLSQIDKEIHKLLLCYTSQKQQLWAICYKI